MALLHTSAENMFSEQGFEFQLGDILESEFAFPPNTVGPQVLEEDTKR